MRYLSQVPGYTRNAREVAEMADARELGRQMRGRAATLARAGDGAGPCQQHSRGWREAWSVQVSNG